MSDTSMSKEPGRENDMNLVSILGDIIDEKLAAVKTELERDDSWASREKAGVMMEEVRILRKEFSNQLMKNLDQQTAGVLTSEYALLKEYEAKGQAMGWTDQQTNDAYDKAEGEMYREKLKILDEKEQLIREGIAILMGGEKNPETKKMLDDIYKSMGGDG